MKRADRSVKFHMTPLPHCTEPHQLLPQVQKKMIDLGVHHLPVRTGGKITGVVSEADLGFLRTLRGINFEKSTVEDLMKPNPLVFSPEASVAEVATSLYENKQNCGLIVDEKQTLLGVFTSTDALRVLAEVFHGH